MAKEVVSACRGGRESQAILSESEPSILFLRHGPTFPLAAARGVSELGVLRAGQVDEREDGGAQRADALAGGVEDR